MTIFSREPDKYNVPESLKSGLEFTDVEGLKFDLGCGAALREGFTGIDFLPIERIFEDEEPPPHYKENYRQMNLFKFPWDIEDNSVAAVHSSHFVEHIPHYRPEYGDVDGWWLFFGELYRVMKPGGVALIGHPYSRSDRAFWDPTHERFIEIMTWFYLDAEWRKTQGINHYAQRFVNFKVEAVDVYGIPNTLEGKSEHAIAFGKVHYFNPWEDISVVLKVVKDE